MRAAFVAMLIALTVVVPPAPSPAAAEARSGRLRVVTFNMLHGGPASGLGGDGQHLEQRLGLAIDELRALHPDVIALQEASTAWGRGNIAARVAAALGLHYVHAPSTERLLPFWLLNKLVVTLMNFEEGPAVLSRYPILATQIVDLPRCLTYLDPRVIVRARIDGPLGPLDVYSTHTSRDDCQVRRVAEIVATRRDGSPAIVMGDFNTPETAAALAAVREQAGMTDAFRASHPDERGATVWQRIDAAEAMARRRVDYVFVASGRRIGVAVADSRVVLDAPKRSADGATLWPSDHYGVLADVVLRWRGGLAAASGAGIPSYRGAVRRQFPSSRGPSHG